MSPRQWRAVIAALILGALFGVIVFAEDDDDPGRTMVYYPGICAVLTPGGYWWGVFKCEDWMNGSLLSETVVTLDADGSLTTHIERVQEDGTVTRFVIHQHPKKGK